MSVRKSDAFIADVERQFEWYLINANLEIAERYLDAVQATVRLIELHHRSAHQAISFISD